MKVNYKGETRAEVRRKRAGERKLAERLVKDLAAMELILRGREALVPEDCALVVNVVNTKALIRLQWSVDLDVSESGGIRKEGI
jgi:hypothetical protein